MKKPKRNLPDEVYERTDEHKAAIEAMKAAHAKLMDAQGERAKALVKLRESRKSPAKAARIEAALDDRIEEVRSEYREALLAELQHGRHRHRRIKDARDEQMLATMERARQRIEREKAARREGVDDADLRELLGLK